MERPELHLDYRLFCLTSSRLAPPQYPITAKGVSSLAYSYYKPEISGETLSRDMVVRER